MITASMASTATSNIGNPNWNITGIWTYNYYLGGSVWTHTMIIDIFHSDSGQFRGHTYSNDNPDDPTTQSLVYGIVEGDTIKCQFIRFAGNTNYYTDAAGVISSNSYMSGDAVSPSQIATWDATKTSDYVVSPSSIATEDATEKQSEAENGFLTGVVKFFNRVKHFGFIAGEDGKDYFVHETGLKPGCKIDEGDKVSFKVVEGEKGPKAEEVCKV